MLGVKEEIGPMQQEANVSIARGSGPELPVWVDPLKVEACPYLLTTIHRRTGGFLANTFSAKFLLNITRWKIESPFVPGIYELQREVIFKKEREVVTGHYGE